MKLQFFQPECKVSDPFPLDLCNQGTRQLNDGKIPIRRFYYMDRGSTCFADIPSFRSQRKKLDNLRLFESLEKRANQVVQKFRWGISKTMLTAVLRFVVTFHTFLLGSLSHSLVICCWPSIDEKQTWLSPDPDSESPCHSYVQECAWLQSLSRIVVSTFRNFQICITEIDTHNAYPKNEL